MCPEKKVIKVMVVDDSMFMRKLISEMLNEDEEVEVIASAKNGEEALEILGMSSGSKAPMLDPITPDVITLDLHMPHGDGLWTLQQIMKHKPIPVIIVTGYAEHRVKLTLECLKEGAVGFIIKPSGEVSLDIKDLKDELLESIKSAAYVHPKKLHMITKPLSSPKKKRISSHKTKIIVIGASTGGPATIEHILSSLPEKFPAILLIAQHMPKLFVESFTNRLQKICMLDVREAKHNDILVPQTVLVAPGNQNMMITQKNNKPTVKLMEVNSKDKVTPNITLLMTSAAQVFGKETIGVLLTGMGDDGVEGLKAIKQNGGKTIVQDKTTALIDGMPKKAREEGLADVVAKLTDISKKMQEAIE